ncbi:hypothetical protein Q9L42_002790 [Methylomarinum sp. Ch1-1]|uniref:Uncharacterized protein n=1 Tax=Methylomarinum roseum TaxID=3067653 RepID=A0AAU7NVN8_9GAMM|nr:hypothetical protein [Methylomarinum sp. Ch1-1]MDP4522904.1 hypothetical protein [Methylomarinum sp. Ch1-1]
MAAEGNEDAAGQSQDLLTFDKMVISKESEVMKSINSMDMDAAEIIRMRSSVSDTAKLYWKVFPASVCMAQKTIESDPFDILIRVAALRT